MGKVALVTGGASGIGKATAERFAASGASVVIADVNPNGTNLVEEWKKLGRDVAYAHTDVRSPSDAVKAVAVAEEMFGRLDILVNNAGIFPRATIEETTEEFWDKVMDINLKGLYHMCRAAIPLMAKSGQGGAIVNIGSLNTFGGTPNLFAYSTSKGGVLSMTLNLARTLAPQRIRVNCVHPGWVLTEGEKVVQESQGSPDNWAQVGGAKLPLGRIQTPDDIAKTVFFLASDDADQITGQSIAVDGGLGFYY